MIISGLASILAITFGNTSLCANQEDVRLQTTDMGVPNLPILESSSQQDMYHATAWYGSRVDFSFITPTESSGWQPADGTEIEFWEIGYYDLLARENSRGICITLKNPPAQEYILKWKHMERPDGGEAGYTVTVSCNNTSLHTQSFSAPARTQAQGGEDISLYFTLPQGNSGNITISFIPSGMGTSGPLVGSIELYEVIGITEVNIDASEATQELIITQDDDNAFTGSDWVISRNRQTHPVAFLSGADLKIFPTFSSPQLPPLLILFELLLP